MVDPNDEDGSGKIDGRTARASRRRAETRARILDAAATCFASDGYHRASVDDIIGRAGIARGTFYLYFGSKRAVLESLLRTLLEGLDHAVRAIRLDADEPPRQQLLANLERSWQVFADDPRLARIVLAGLHGVEPDFDSQVAAVEDHVLAMTMRSIVAGQRLGWLRTFDPRTGACALLGAFKENLADGVLRGTAPTSGRQRVAAMLDILLPGVALPPLQEPR